MKKGVGRHVTFQGAGRFSADYIRPERSVDGLNVSVYEWGERRIIQGWIVCLDLLEG